MSKYHPFLLPSPSLHYRYDANTRVSSQVGGSVVQSGANGDIDCAARSMYKELSEFHWCCGASLKYSDCSCPTGCDRVKAVGGEAGEE